MTRKAYTVKNGRDSWGNWVYDVVDWTGRVVTSKLSSVAAHDAADRLTQHLLNYGDAVEAGLDVSDLGTCSGYGEDPERNPEFSSYDGSEEYGHEGMSE